MSNFKAGDKVVCIIPEAGPNTQALEKGKVYSVRESGTIKGVDGVWLVGVVNGRAWWNNIEFGYKSARFRLVSEVKLIMSAVRKSKKPKTSEVP